jgi:glutamyl-tRNA synthetase
LEPFKEILKEKAVQASDEYIKKVIGLVKERADFITDLWDQSWFLFRQPGHYDPKSIKKRWKDDTPHLLEELLDEIEKKWDPSGLDEEQQKESFKNIVKQMAEKKDIGMGKIMIPLRISLVGASSGPDLDAMVVLLGREETIDRVRKAIREIE